MVFHFLVPPAVSSLFLLEHHHRSLVYNPKSGSNEEDSDALFRIFSEAVGLNPSDASTVSRYIIATKRHDVSDSEDQDLRAFIDLDMAVVGRERSAYFTYASQVKKRTQHGSPMIYILRSRFSYPESNNLTLCFGISAYTSGLLLSFCCDVHAFYFPTSSRGGRILLDFFFVVAVPMALHDTGMGIRAMLMPAQCHGTAMAMAWE